MIGVVEQQSIVIEEHRLGVIKRDAMLTLVSGGLAWVPFKPELLTMCNVCTAYVHSKRALSVSQHINGGNHSPLGIIGL